MASTGLCFCSILWGWPCSFCSLSTQVTFIMGFFVQLNISRWWNHRPDLVIWASLFHVWPIVWSRVFAEVSLPKIEVLRAGSSWGRFTAPKLGLNLLPTDQHSEQNIYHDLSAKYWCETLWMETDNHKIIQNDAKNSDTVCLSQLEWWHVTAWCRHLVSQHVKICSVRPFGSHVVNDGEPPLSMAFRFHPISIRSLQL